MHLMTILIFKFRKYPIYRQTSLRQITYFVRENFQTEYTGDLKRLELNIEEDYINSIRTKCIREKEYCK